jgi:aquaporin Z
MNKLLAEFLGTFGFCAVALLSGSPLAAAAALAVAVYALGYISGGHFNPAVSVAVWLRGQLAKGDMLRYAAAQMFGAVTAFLLFKILSDGALTVAKTGVPWFPVFLGETFFMGFTSLVFLHVRTARQQLGNTWFGAALGMSHYAGASALNRISAGACNPALGLAFALAGLVPAWMIPVYLLAGVLAGAAAAIAYRILNPND